jgi:hypothetical protein
MCALLSATRSRPTGALVVGITLLAGSAFAKKTCPLAVRLDRPDPAWETAVNRARSQLETAQGDCDSVELSVEGRAAALTFTTSDGRHAVRTLHDPKELESTLAALLVPLPLVEPSPAPPAHGVPAAPPPPPPALMLSGVAGARIAGPGPLLTPVVGIGAALSLSGWDVGVAGTWCPSYVSLIDDVTLPGRLTSIAAGVVVGRRLPIEKSVALLVGANLAAAFEHEEWRVVDESGRTVDREAERGQMLVGAYAGAAFPTEWKTRFRSTVSGDIDALHAGSAATTVDGAPSLPVWGVTVALGVEGEVL